MPPTTCRPPHAAHRMPPTACRPPHAAHRMPPTACRPPHAAHRMPPTTCRPPHAAHHMPARRKLTAFVCRPPHACVPHITNASENHIYKPEPVCRPPHMEVRPVPTACVDRLCETPVGTAWKCRLYGTPMPTVCTKNACTPACLTPGVRQRCVIPPALFNVFVHHFLQEALSQLPPGKQACIQIITKSGGALPTDLISCIIALTYADNLALLSDSPDAKMEIMVVGRPLGRVWPRYFRVTVPTKLYRTHYPPV
eukprot:363926-Chlamydomonas_euryale.AAC.8